MAKILLPQPDVVWGFRLHYVRPEIRRWFVGLAVVALIFATKNVISEGSTLALWAVLFQYIMIFIVTMVMIPAINRFMRQIGADSAGNQGMSEYVYALVDVMVHLALAALSIVALYRLENVP